MRVTSVTAVAVAAVLMLAITFSAKIVTSVYEELEWRCNDGINLERSCGFLLHWAFQDLDVIYRDFQYQPQRNKISKRELPTLEIYISDGAFAKLKRKRRYALRHGGILITNDDDWVNAKVIANNGGPTKKVDALIRLKGDWVAGKGDHLADEKKLSMRIKISKNQRVYGMSKFSIHQPTARGNNGEGLMLDMFRYMNVLAPRYFFVDVRINDELVGVMALEEHFSKELAESQNRRWGAIIAIDEDLFWQQTVINQTWSPYLPNHAGGAKSIHTSNLTIRDYPVKIFRPGKFNPETVESQHGAKAVSLLRDYIDGRVAANHTFDIDLMSRWWIINLLWGGYHALTWNNQRYFFNPISERLEPIPFDNIPNLKVEGTLSSGFGLVSLVNDPLFREFTRKNIKEISYTLHSNEFQDWFISRKADYAKWLSIDKSRPSSVSLDLLKENLRSVSLLVNKLFSESPADDKPITPSQRLLLHINVSTTTHGIVPSEESIDEADATLIDDIFAAAPLYTHLRPFWFWSPDSTDLEIKNLTTDPITIHSVFPSKDPKNNILFKEVVIPVYQEGGAQHIFKSPIDASAFNLSDQLLVSYSYQGQRYTRPVFLQFRKHKSAYASPESTRAWFDKNSVLLGQATKTITFGPGQYSFTSSLQTERGWAVEILPGAVLEFKKGARLKVNGPIRALGSEDLPIKLVVDSDPNLGLLGSWGGLLISEASQESILRHTHVTGVAVDYFSARQDSYGLTGCITFYKSNVRIEHSKFIGLQCEDALNIVDSDFELDHVEFVGVSADAFDSDFSMGILTNASFRNVMNDGLDLSGSNVEVRAARFFNIGDKAISTGEKSALVASELVIDDSETGVVSKDKSVVNISSSSFRKVKNALMAYEKKAEWGPAEIHCNNCEFDDVASVAVEQYGSRITLNGNEISPSPFTRKQLQIAGY